MRVTASIAFLIPVNSDSFVIDIFFFFFSKVFVVLFFSLGAKINADVTKSKKNIPSVILRKLTSSHMRNSLSTQIHSSQLFSYRFRTTRDFIGGTSCPTKSYLLWVCVVCPATENTNLILLALLLRIHFISRCVLRKFEINFIIYFGSNDFQLVRGY